MALFGNFPSFAELIKRVIAEDEEAQSTLFNRFASRLYGYIRYMFERNRCVRPEEDSLDVANWVWFKALNPKNLKGLNNVEAFESWLYAIARNDVIAHLRKCTRNPLLELDDPDAAEPVGQTRTSQEIIESSEHIQQILIRAKSVDKRLYQILALELQGLTDQEIGERLGISWNNVRTIRSRKLLKLRALLKEKKRGSRTHHGN